MNKRVLGRRLRTAGGVVRNRVMGKILANSLFTKGAQRNDISSIEYNRDNTGEKARLVEAIDVLDDLGYI